MTRNLSQDPNIHDITHLLKSPLAVMSAQAKLTKIMPTNKTTIDDLVKQVEFQTISMNLSLDNLQLLADYNNKSLLPGTDLIDLSEVINQLSFNSKNLTLKIDEPHITSGSNHHFRQIALNIISLLENDGATNIILSINKDSIIATADVEDSSITRDLKDLSNAPLARNQVVILKSLQILAELYKYKSAISADGKNVKIEFKRHESQ